MRKDSEYIKSRIVGFKTKSKAVGQVCDIDSDFITGLLEKEICACCGIRFDKIVGYQHQPMHIDRVVPELGYTKSNVQAICERCNRIKSFGSGEEHARIAEYIFKYRAG